MNNVGELNEDYLFDEEQGNNGQGNDGNNGGGNNNGIRQDNGIMYPAGNQDNQGNQNNNGGQGNQGGQSNEEEIFSRINEGLSGTRNQQQNDGGNGSNNNGNKFNYGAFSISDEDDYTSVILKQNGINPNAIPIIDENGNETAVSFSDLTRQEQVDMLMSLGGNNGYELDDSEVDIINAIRRTGLSPEKWVESFKQRVISEYANNISNNGGYEIDSLTDDELWLSDYKSKVKNATEEEAINTLNNAKTNSQLFERTVAGMRQVYKEQEEEYNKQREERQQELARQRAEQYESAIIDAVNSNSKMRFGDLGFSLTDDDKEDIASFILDNDPSGQNMMLSAMSNNNELVKMAFMYLKGNEIIEEMQKDYKRQIAEARNSSYNKGYEDAKAGRNMSFSVNRPALKNNKNGGFRKIATIDDLDIDL